MAGGVISKSGKAYPGELTGSALITCMIAACGGLIFGYDIGISGGVTSMPIFLKKFFPKVYEKEVLNVAGTNQYCKFSDKNLTLFTSSLYLAALVSSMVAGTVTRVFGRKLSMIFGGLLFLTGAILNAFASHVYMLILGRLFLGLGIGFANQAVPVYLSEMAPYKYRGGCNMLFQLSITIGILVANGINYGTAKLKTDLGWRLSLGLAALPAVAFIIGSLIVPDTPNSLIERGKQEEAKIKLRRIRGVEDIDDEFDDMLAASIESKKVEHPWGKLLRGRKYTPQLVFVILIPFFQQFTGMNVFMFYAPVLFKTIGFGDAASLGSSLITGAVNMVATFVSIYYVDKVGRRFLFIQGGIQMFICQMVITGCIAWKFGTNGNPGELPTWFAAIVVVAICVYVAGFAWSWGPLGWLVPSEILPLEVRSVGQTTNVVVNMVCTFVIAQLFLGMMCKMKFGLFIFFSVFVILMTIFIIMFLPETKGIPIEEMSEIWEKHWAWKHFVIQEVDVEMSNEQVKKNGD
ncbi:hypothetical protein RD792_016115 [Penstemon davidsonii]|uniref:Major facilitator superfamily (MFS) profile domain-containing protein n=1 Tax=Penstemon davidsonii TaxID=160366 RepID=A0ABR0CKC3_9LAMI|nr:hypothetical protein RD792_016115 [Penstemon davidsonii]